MGIFSKINSCFLAIAVVLTTISQIQPSSAETPVSSPTQDSKIPAYSDLSGQFVWDFIDLDSSFSLLNLYSKTDSEEDSKDSFDTTSALQFSLQNISALYLLFARDIDVNPTIGELLYPFYFYF